MIVYGLVDVDLEDRTGFGDFIETYMCKEHAHADLAQVLTDEPTWAQRLCIVAIELNAGNPN